jgi:Tol biopolymer transport system component
MPENRAQMSPQQLIAHYRITAKLGEGGMGEVWRATDTKLNRDVAIKILPDSFAHDSGRLARFEREAQLLAALNHPNIAAIYGIERGAIVMELVEGVSPAGPLPVATVVDYARQIAAGLEAAHEKGIIHRDLKPANIKVTPQGLVKLLDFGLAKAREESTTPAPPANPTVSPTLSMAMTQAGMILGTAAYMSPEQARGQAVDRRADIWAYGIILFELLTGQHPYGIGGTVTDTLAAIVLKDPEFSLLPKDTPPQLRRLIARCLRKDQKTRLRDIGDAGILLDEPAEEPAEHPSWTRRTWLPWAIAATAIAIAAGATGIAWMRPGSGRSDPGRIQFGIPLPGGAWPRSSAATQWVPSPDGRSLAMVAPEGTSTALWLRPLNAPGPHRLDKTEGANFPFWSPDGRWIGFFTEDTLKRVPASGGAVQTICQLGTDASSRSSGDGATWNSDGVILFAPGLRGLMKVAAAGGVPASATTLEKGETWHSWPQFLPDGHHFLYLAKSIDRQQDAIYVQEMGSTRRVRLLKNGNRVQWLPPGYLLLTQDGSLYAQRMNVDSLKLEGEPVLVAEDVAANDVNGRSTFAVSQNGVLAFRNGSALGDRQLNWRGADGKVIQAVGKPGQFNSAILSPDEKSIAFLTRTANRGQDLWVMDLTNGVVTPITRDGKMTYLYQPVWSPDSKEIVFSTSDGMFKATVASGHSIFLTKDLAYPQAWSPDGREILCRDASYTQISLLSLTDGPKLRHVSTTPYRVTRFAYSTDGKYVAYQSFETGSGEIFVAAFPSFAVKRRVSQNGAVSVAWTENNSRLVFRTGDGSINEVEVRLGPEIQIGNSRTLFRLPTSSGMQPNVSADGQRFLTLDPVTPAKQPEAPEVSIVVNWAADLKLR